MVNGFRQLTVLSLIVACGYAAACAGGKNVQDDDDHPPNTGTGVGGNDGGGTATGGGTGATGGNPAGGQSAACTTAADPGSFTFQKIARWRDDAEAAYTMIHDDICDYGVRGIYQNAVPALESYGLTAGMGAIVEECINSDYWDELAEVESKGNEICNHSYSHEAIDPSNFNHQVVDAKTELDSHLSNPVTFFVFPYDYFTTETINLMKNSGLLGARGGNRDDNDGADNPPINPSTPTADYEVEFDVWPRTYSKY